MAMPEASNEQGYTITNAAQAAEAEAMSANEPVVVEVRLTYSKSLDPSLRCRPDAVEKLGRRRG
jgi:hypothetical protein